MKKTLGVILAVLVLVCCAGALSACGGGNSTAKDGTGELTLANYQLLETGKTSPAEARKCLGSPNVDQIVMGAGNMVWTKGDVTVTLQFVNNKLITKVQTGLS